MKPWREITVPHRDVLEGTFQQSEFAADITAVNTGKASREYQDAVSFYERTFITEGMSLLVRVRVRLDRRPAQSCRTPNGRLVEPFPEGSRPHKRLVVESGHEDWREERIDRADIPP